MSVPAQYLTLPDFAVKVNGRILEGEAAWQIGSVAVEQHVKLPGMFTLELASLDHRNVNGSWLEDDQLFAIGHEVEVQLGYAGTGLHTLINGEITALEPEFSSSELPRMTVRGYDRRHRLQRGHKIRTFSRMKDSDIARRIAGEAGLSAEVTDSKVEHEYLVQANQTDLDFLLDRAHRINFAVLVDGKKLSFRRVANDSKPSLRLSLEDDSLSEFRARLASSGQVTQASVRGWDAKQKKEIVARANSVKPMGGRQSGAALVKRAFGAAEELVVTQPLVSLAEADQLAQARLDMLTLPLIRAEGVCPGYPELHAGMVVEIQGVGKRFSGPYYVVTAAHRYGPAGYSTHFTMWRNAI